MAKSLNFKDLEIWKSGIEVSCSLYDLLKDCSDYGLKNQIQRAAVSIPSNIAEGYGRQTVKEQIQFLFIARGSCYELETQLIIAQKINLLEAEKTNIILEKTAKLSQQIFNFINYLKNK